MTVKSIGILSCFCFVCWVGQIYLTHPGQSTQPDFCFLIWLQLDSRHATGQLIFMRLEVRMWPFEMKNYECWLCWKLIYFVALFVELIFITNCRQHCKSQTFNIGLFWFVWSIRSKFRLYLSISVGAFWPLFSETFKFLFVDNSYTFFYNVIHDKISVTKTEYWNVALKMIYGLTIDVNTWTLWYLINRISAATQSHFWLLDFR